MNLHCPTPNILTNDISIIKVFINKTNKSMPVHTVTFLLRWASKRYMLNLLLKKNKNYNSVVRGREF